MTTAKIFRCGTGQAVQLPKRYQFKGKEVEIFRRGATGSCCAKKSPGMTRAFELLASLPLDFQINKRRDRPQKRKFR